MAVLGERRVIRYCVLKTQPTEPAVGQIEVYLFTQPSLGTNAEAVTDDQHPHHQVRINRGPPRVAIERYEVAAQIAEVEAAINPAQQVI
jgi:hypothetical protein